MSASFKCKASIMIAFCILLGGFNTGLANEMRESDVLFAGATITQTVVSTQTAVYRVISIQDLALKIAGYLLHQTFPLGNAGSGKQRKKETNQSSNYSIASFEKRHYERMDLDNTVTVFHRMSAGIVNEGAPLLNIGKVRLFLFLKIYLLLHVLMLITALAGSGIFGWGCASITADAIPDIAQLRTISWVFYFTEQVNANGGGIQ